MAITVKLSPSSPVTKSKVTIDKSIVPKVHRRRVSFDEKKNKAYDNERWTAEECQQLWYSRLDFKNMKFICASLVTQVAKIEQRVKDEQSYRSVILRVYDHCCEASHISAADDKLLKMWIERSKTRSGLERLSIPEINHDRRHRRQVLMKTVLEVQNCHKAGSAHSRAELLRRASVSASRASRLFAWQLANALESSQ